MKISEQKTNSFFAGGISMQVVENTFQLESNGKDQKIEEVMHGLTTTISGKDIEEAEKDKSKSQLLRLVKKFGLHYSHRMLHWKWLDMDGEEKKHEAITLFEGSVKCDPTIQIEDTLFTDGTENDSSEKSTKASADLPVSALQGKTTRSQKSLQTSQPWDVIQVNDASTAFQNSETEFNDCFFETCQGEAVNSERRNTPASVMQSVIQEDDACHSVEKTKPLSDDVRGRHVETLLELDKEPLSSNQMAVERFRIGSWTVMDSNTTPILIENLPLNIGIRNEQKSIGVGQTENSLKCHSNSVPTEILPDLTITMAPASVPFQCSFKVSQQVQLHAQILVYGSLIQGSLPDKALMVAAFRDIGASHNGSASSNDRSCVWERAWQFSADRIQVNSSKVITLTTSSSMPSVSACEIQVGMKTPSQLARINVPDSMSPILGMRLIDLEASGSHCLMTTAVNTPIIRNFADNNMPAAISPTCSASLSPLLWDMSSSVNVGIQDFSMSRCLHRQYHQGTPERYLHQAPQLWNHAPKSEFPCFSSSSFLRSGVSHSQAAPSDSGFSVCTFAVPEVTQETTIINMDTENEDMGDRNKSNSEHQSQKRNKSHASEGFAGTSSLTSVGMEVTCTSISTCFLSVSVTPAQEVHACKVSNDLWPTVSRNPSVCSVSHQQIISSEIEEDGICLVETSHLEEAKLNAEEAASIATMMVRHSQAIWRQLYSQKNSGLVSDHEARLASSAVAAAAAASVAKAAAAVAKVSYEVSVRAKLVAEETLSSDFSSDVTEPGGAGLLEGSLGKAIRTPPTLQGKEKYGFNSQIASCCQSIIASLEEPSQQRVEAVSSATKTAQNLDAIARAAALIAEAVSQAGDVITMGDPVQLIMNTPLEIDSEGLVNQVVHTLKKSDIHQNEAWLPKNEGIKISERCVKHLNTIEQTAVCNKEGVKAPSEKSSKQRGKTHASNVLHCDIIHVKKDPDDHKKICVLNEVQSALSVCEGDSSQRKDVAVPEGEHDTELKSCALDALHCDNIHMEKDEDDHKKIHGLNTIRTDFFVLEAVADLRKEVVVPKFEHGTEMKDHELDGLHSSIIHTKEDEKDHKKIKVLNQVQSNFSVFDAAAGLRKEVVVPEDKHDTEMKAYASDGLQNDIIYMKKDVEDQKKVRVLNETHTDFTVSEADGVQRKKKVVPEAENGIATENESLVPRTNQIKEGSRVEVVSDEKGLRRAWLPAKVLRLNEGKALVCYDRVLSDKDQVLQEWVSLFGGSGKAPRIRMAHPTTVIKFGGIRKRRRAEMSDHILSVGDHVDAWTHYGFVQFPVAWKFKLNAFHLQLASKRLSRTALVLSYICPIRCSSNKWK
eukprot:Gb_03602 [translate_table: standard]